MKCSYLTVALTCYLNCAIAQNQPLFQSRETLNIRASGSIKSIKKKSNDSTFVTGKFQYRQDTSWITVPVQTRVRGNFRLKNCYFPPLKVKFSKKDVASTIFEGNKSLKLVVPCLTTGDKNELIRREYLCYQFAEVLLPYHFRTRLTTFDLTEVSRKNARSFQLLAFFVEDNSLVAKRTQARLIETKGIHPARFDELQALRSDFFQYMIGNADWSAVFQHNSNLLQVNGKYIPLSYDFDMSGFVNAPYAREKPPNLGTGDPRERVYRGFCRSTPAVEQIKDEFLGKESAIHAIIDQHAQHFSEYEVKDMHHYLEGFFDILKNQSQFKMNILAGCRKE